MKHLKSQALLILIIIFSTNSFCQSLDNFNDVLKAKKIDKVFTRKVNKDISERTFLGSIKDKKGKVKYYVVKEFLRIQAAIVYHGHSRILFFNSQEKLTFEAILSSKNELPFELKNNHLYFSYSENGEKKIFSEDLNTLPKMLCVEPKSCYSISNP